MNRKLSVQSFLEEFPDEAASLQHIMSVRYGLRHPCRSCQRESDFLRVPRRRAFACASCGATIYPCVGTIFERSRTPLHLWFYALYLFSVRARGVSSRELQRELGVTYKTAWRMSQQIRLLMQRLNALEASATHDDMMVTVYREDADSCNPVLSNAETTIFKRQASKIHGHISPKYASRYYAEFAFRSHHQGPQHTMFHHLIGSL